MSANTFTVNNENQKKKILKPFPPIHQIVIK